MLMSAELKCVSHDSLGKVIVCTHTPPPPPPSFDWIFQKGVLTGSQFLRKVAGKEGVTILRGLQFLPKNCLRMKNVNIVGDSRNILTFRGGVHKKPISALQIRTGQWSVTTSLQFLTAHIYRVMIIVTGGFFQKSFFINIIFIS